MLATTKCFGFLTRKTFFLCPCSIVFGSFWILPVLLCPASAGIIFVVVVGSLICVCVAVDVVVVPVSRYIATCDMQTDHDVVQVLTRCCTGPCED